MNFLNTLFHLIKSFRKGLVLIDSFLSFFEQSLKYIFQYDVVQ